MNDNPDKGPPSRAEDGILLGRELATAVVIFQEAVASQFGLSGVEWRCLEVLVRGGPITAGALARETHLSTGAITGIVDRLERAGHVRRVAHPIDRRSILVEPTPTPKFEAAVGLLFASLGSAVAALASAYSEQELARIAAYLRGLIDTLKQETAALTAGTPGRRSNAAPTRRDDLPRADSR